METPYKAILRNKTLLIFLLPLSLLSLILHLSQSPDLPSPTIDRSDGPDRCSSRYIYIQNLPNRFNTDILTDCSQLAMDQDMCPYTTNGGFGVRVDETSDNADALLPGSSWYVTNQYTIELIFHNRMKYYQCLTTDSTIASAVFVPFYAGLDIGRHLIGQNMSVRDSLSLDLIEWIKARPEWKVMGGRDHFLLSGRNTWDLRRNRDDEGTWGSKFLLLPEAKNLTVLSVETVVWERNEFGIAFPTYFHPSMESEVISWQAKVRTSKRPWLFSFMGGRRTQATTNANVRDRVVDQCAESTHCKLQECGKGKKNSCHSPANVMRLYQNSVFCLQPPGDSYTRRSTFDSMLAGCIPVFFHRWTAYDQYKWYFPDNYTVYSVYIPGDEVREGRVRIEEVLLRYSDEQVREMRERVIEMIPRIVYRDPRSKLAGFRDAFDVAIDGVLERIRGIRKPNDVFL